MSAVLPSTVETAERGWRRVAPLLVATLAWVILCYRETFLAMAHIWTRSETFTHGFVVPPIVLWLIWRQRQRLARLAPAPNFWLLLPLAATGFGWLLGHLAAVNAVTQLAATAVLVLTVVAVVGIRVAGAIAFPLAFLFFAVPIGEFVMPRLMEWTADFTVLALRFTGIPVYREGLSFIIPSGNWSVVEACSGVRYLIASLMVGTLFAYLNYHSLRRRLIFIAVSALVPIFANWLRAYMIVMLGHVSGNTLAVGVDHLIYGWLFFGVVIMLMFFIGARWSEDEPSLPEVEKGTGAAAFPARRQWVAVALAVPVIAWPLAANFAIEQSDAATVPALSLPPAETLGGWSPQPAAESDISPAYEDPPAKVEAVYGKDGRSTGLYVAYYRNQSYGQKLVTSTNTLVKSSDHRWTVTGTGSQPVRVDGIAVDARSYQLVSGLAGAAGTTSRLVVWQWYWVNGRLTASDAEAKIYTALSRLRGEGDDSAVVFVYALEGQPGGGSETLGGFVGDAGAAVNAMLGRARAQR